MSSFISLEALESSLDEIRRSPAIEGTVKNIVIRPEKNEREVLESCDISLEEGVIGDNWKRRGYKKTVDGSAHPDMQINIMNSRVIAAIAGEHLQQSLAGDQLYVDFDLSKQNLPPGTRLSIGGTELEVTAEPHLGCLKFAERFGRDAVKFVNSTEGKALNLRGINVKVIFPGTVSVGSSVRILV